MPKKLLIWLVIAFAAFYLFTQPAEVPRMPSEVRSRPSAMRSGA